MDRWFVLIGLLYGTFGMGFGIWMGIHQRFDQAHLHAHINLIGFASMILFGLLYRSFPALAASRLALAHFLVYNIGAAVFLAGLPLAQSGQTIALAVIGSMMVVLGMLIFLANYLMNGFGAKAA
ncbi:MAG: hypothetical protein KDJ72_02740 [Methyloceanibacter sp.]|uniref:hypothetical protein n=1 Tax=Methyloceanibacter sp. TaxID=1965321 RepID=UPI001E158DFC|nr:hypothetical protein [Methyloceanibacter sp.]MCB1441914.1 hypothetical protein [Methyloceanibacter sp.]